VTVQPAEDETDAHDADSNPDGDADAPLTVAVARMPTDASAETPTQVSSNVQPEGSVDPEAAAPSTAAPVEDGAPAETPEVPAPDAKPATAATPTSSASAAKQTADSVPVNPVQPTPVRASSPAPDQQTQAPTPQDAASPLAQTDGASTSSKDGADSQTQQKQPELQPAQAKPAAHADAPKPTNPAVEPVYGKSQPDALPEPVRALAATLNPASVHSMTMRAAALNERAPVPLTGTALAAEIISRVRDGMRRFDIRLDPPELGRVDVRLEVDRAGNVKTHMTVDRADTLELVQREARGLERALQQAGLKTDGGGLEFSLRSHADHPQADGQPGRQSREPDFFSGEGGERIEAVIEGYRSAALARGGVDIRI
jgi:chemotaxis protein MotD